MKHLRPDGRHALICLLGLIIPAGACAEESRISLTTGMDYSAGKYGGTGDVVIRYVPLTLKYMQGNSTFKATLPYLSVTSPASGTLVDGDGNVVSSGVGRQVTREGLGDAVMSYSYALVARPYHGFLLDIGGKVKLATGDDSAGLGTGEIDYALTADMYRLMGKWTPFLGLVYRLPGDPPGTVLRNTWAGTLGVNYKRSDSDSIGLMWDQRQASRAGRPATSEATAYWSHKLSRELKAQVYAVAGFSDASPDYGLGGMLTLRY